MREIKLTDAKASLSSLVDDAALGKPSTITRYGKPAAVVVGFKEWERLTKVPSFGRLLMSAPISGKDLPRRSRKPMRFGLSVVAALVLATLKVERCAY